MAIDAKLLQKDKVVDAVQAVADKRLISSYKTALVDIQADIAKLYASVGEDISLASASKFDRLSKLQTAVKSELTTLGVSVKATTVNASSTAFKEAYYRTAFTLETEGQIKLGFSVLPTDTIAKAVQAPIGGLTLNETLAANRAKVLIDVRRAITQGLIQGESFPKMAASLKGVLEKDAGKAMRVVRTEVHRVNNQATMDAGLHAQAKGLEMKKMWVATLDDRTRDAHGALDGVTIELKENFTSDNGGSGMDPGNLGTAEDDINCRCTMVYVFPDTVLDERRVEGEIVPYTNYEDWAKNRLSSTPAKPST